MLDYMEYTIQQNSLDSIVVNLVFKDPSKNNADKKDLKQFLDEFSSLDSEIIDLDVKCESLCKLCLKVRYPMEYWSNLDENTKQKVILSYSHEFQEAYNQQFPD